MDVKIAPYDQKALDEARDFKYPSETVWGNLKDVVGKPFGYLSKSVSKAIDGIPGVGDAINKATDGIIVLLNDAAQYTVRQDSIIQEFKEDGFSFIESIRDIHKLDLASIDRTVGRLAMKYNALAATEGGAVAGGPLLAGPGYPVAMAAAIAADIPIFTGLCMRAIGEYATYYGFDINNQQERAYMLNILGLASAGTTSVKNSILTNLAKLSEQLAKNVPWKILNQNSFVMLINKIAEQFGIRITKGKLAMIIPAAGIAFNSGFNVYMMNEICNISYLLYRERYVASFYNNPDLISKHQ